ncbi:MAG TPA: ABC transporter permease [Roseiflexaceae bacterium]|nr:ABC transporter permease [Roseiflexaceae bacterium]
MERRDDLIRKLAWALFTVLFVAALNFFMFRILPGDPAKALVRDPRLKKEVQDAIRARFGLDKPLVFNTSGNPFDSQFFRYFGALGRGDMGISFNFNRPVADLLRERLFNTVLLVVVGQTLAIVAGVLLGLLAAWRRGTALDVGSLLFGLFTWSLPTFWLGIILLIVGSSRFGLPVGGMQTAGANLSGWARFLDVARHMAMPTITFTIILLGEYMLIMRSALLEVLGEDYILTAKAKGLTDSQILRDHAVRNALLPVVTLVALNLGFTVAGAVQVESVFSWPGLGSAIFEAVSRRDYPMLQGAFLLIAISVVLANLAADLLYAYLDPRVKAA